MAGSNTTGTPNTKFYTLGRGRLFIAELDTDGAYVGDGYRDLGNCPSVTATLDIEELEHRSSREGTSNIDKTVTISRDLTVGIETDELSMENMALFLAGTVQAYTNAAVAGFAQYEMIPSVTLGRSYEIVNSTGQRAYGVAATDLALEVDAVPLVAGTDYVLDSVNGLIFFPTTAVNVADTDAVDVTLTANGSAASVTEMQGMTQSDKEYAVKFISVNPATNDEETEYTFWRVRLRADGEMGLVSDEWATMSYSGKATSNTTLESSGATCTIRYLDGQ